MDKYIAELLNAEFHLRKSGRTTRLLDAYMQILFAQGIVIIRDHDDWVGDSRINLYAFQRFCDRLSNEHPNVKFFFNKENPLNLYVHLNKELTKEQIIYLHNNKMFRNAQDARGWKPIN